jgi:nucleoside-diphosphate-sugar epimerase
LTKIRQFSGEKVLVTGASGYIGPHLCLRLCKSGDEVHAVSRMRQHGEDSCPNWWQGDLADIDVVRDLLKTINPDVIFHLAGHAAGGRELELVLPTFHSNLATTINLLSVAAEIGCRRIVLPGSLEEPNSLDAEVLPSSPYAASKWAGSAYARMFHKLYETPIVIARLFMTYGPGKQNPRKLIPYVITSLLRGRAPKVSSGERQIDWIYIDDAVDGLIAAARAPDVEGCVIDLGSGSLVSIKTMVHKIMDLMDPSLEPLFGASPDRPMEQVRVANIENTNSKIGWEPSTLLESGLQKTVDWYRTKLS